MLAVAQKNCFWSEASLNFEFSFLLSKLKLSEIPSLPGNNLLRRAQIIFSLVYSLIQSQCQTYHVKSYLIFSGSVEYHVMQNSTDVILLLTLLMCVIYFTTYNENFKIEHSYSTHLKHNSNKQYFLRKQN